MLSDDLQAGGKPNGKGAVSFLSEGIGQGGLGRGDGPFALRGLRIANKSFP